MASAPQPNLPLFFKDLMPLNSKDHANYRSRPMTKAPWLAKQHAVPLTVDEFVQAQRDMPIVFSTGPEAVPLALMGLNDGVNTFVDEEGTMTEQVYIPAYSAAIPSCLPVSSRTATNCRCASIRLPRTSASSMTASRFSRTVKPAKEPSRSSNSASSSNMQASARRTS